MIKIDMPGWKQVPATRNRILAGAFHLAVAALNSISAARLWTESPTLIFPWLNLVALLLCGGLAAYWFIRAWTLRKGQEWTL